jgi:hypothetical protein
MICAQYNCCAFEAEYVAEAFSILDDDGKLALVLEFDLYHYLAICTMRNTIASSLLHRL